MTARLLADYRRLNDALAAAIVGIAGAMVAVMALAPGLAALLRLTTGHGYDLLAELPPQLVPWIVFPMIGVLLRRERHINVDVVPHFLGGRALDLLRIMVAAISLGGCLVFAFYGVEAVGFYQRLGQTSTTEFEFPLWWLYVSYPIGFFLAANFCCEMVLRRLAGEPPPPRETPAEIGGLL